MATTKNRPAVCPEQPLDLLRARHELLRAELATCPVWNRENNWYTERLRELHALERRISAAANEPTPRAITIHLTPAQLAMVDEVARHDRHADVAAFVAHEVKEAVFCFRCDLHDEDLNTVRHEWENGQGKEAA